MSLTVGRLAAEQLVGLELIAGHSGLDRRVEGAMTLSSPDSVDWIRPGDFVGTSGYLYRQEPERLEEVILAVSNCGGAGFMVKLGRYVREIPSNVLTLADKLGVPIFVMPPDWAPRDVTAKIMEAVLGSGEDQVVGLSYLRRALAGTLVTRDGPSGSEILSRYLGRKASISLAEEPQPSSEGRYTFGVGSPSNHLFLVVECERPELNLQEVGVVRDASELLAAGLIAEERARLAGLCLASRVVRAVLKGDESWREAAEKNVLRDLGWTTAQSYLMLRCAGATEDELRGLRRTVKRGRAASPFEIGTDGGAFLVAIPVEDEDDARGIAGALDAWLRQRGHRDIRIALSRPYRGLVNLPFACADVLRAARYATSARGVARYPGIEVAAFLEDVGVGPLKALVATHLAPLIEHDRETGDDYVRTLKCFLDCGCRASSAAKVLKMHPQTITYRLRRMRELFGVDVSDPERRLMLQMAIRAMAVTGEAGRP